MSIADWWPKLQPSTRDWLIANNGDAVPAAMVVEITEAVGPDTSDEWVGQDGPAGLYLSDAAVDWIEAVANEETPDSER